MKITVELGFSHIRDSIQAIDALYPVGVDHRKRLRPSSAQRISLQHLRRALMEGLPVEMQRIVAGKAP